MSTSHANWFETFFQGLAVDFWREIVKSMPTGAEVDYIVKHVALAPGAKVLDVPCGTGRHSLELARRGFHVTGVDLSPQSLETARQLAAAENLSIDFQLADMRQLTGSFDAAICMGNSFGYLPHPEMLRFIEALQKVLKPGARFLLQLGCVAETLLPLLKEEATYPVGDITMQIRNTYDVAASVLQTEYTFIKNGGAETKRGWQTIYTSGELCRLFTNAGFRIVRLDQSTDAQPYALKAAQLFLIAQRA